MEHGVEKEHAERIVSHSVLECKTHSRQTLKEIHDLQVGANENISCPSKDQSLQKLFRDLRSHGVKIAICTADSR